MNHYRLYLFGPPRLEHGGQRIEINLKKALALLAYLGRTGQPQSRDLLATLLWPESDQTDGRASLRRTLYRLNRLANEEIITGTQELVEINPQTNLWIDVNAYEVAVQPCLPDKSASTNLDQDCRLTLQDAAELYQEDFLAGFTLPDCPEFDEWQYFQREDLRQLHAQALAALARHYAHRREWSEAVRFARRRVALDPMDEAAQRTLIELYAAGDQSTAAIRQYDELIKLLDEELGVEPEPETRQLIENVRAGRLIIPASNTFTPPDTRYVRTRDGVHIAYQVFGDGPVDLVAIWGFITHLEQIWDNGEARAYLQKLSSFARVIQLDRRGMGLSERIGYPPTPEQVAEDVLAIMDAVGSERAVFIGFSEGGSVAVSFTALHPERVRGIIIYGAMAKGVRSPDYPWTLNENQYNTWFDRMTQNWGTAFSLENFAPSRAHDPELREWWQRYLRSACSPGTIREVLEALRDLDVRPILPHIKVPTLVIHRTGDRVIRIGNGRYFAEHIPDAQYIELEGDDHLWFFVEDQDQIIEPIVRFIQSLPPVSDEPHTLTAIVCLRTDDQPDQLEAVVQQHEATILASGESELLIRCPGPTPALRCAANLRGPERKIGIHFGTINHHKGHPSGTAVQIARQLASAAAEGEILISLAVRGLTSSSGFAFDAVNGAGKPLPAEAWQVFRVR